MLLLSFSFPQPFSPVNWSVGKWLSTYFPHGQFYWTGSICSDLASISRTRGNLSVHAYYPVISLYGPVTVILTAGNIWPSGQLFWFFLSFGFLDMTIWFTILWSNHFLLSSSTSSGFLHLKCGCLSCPCPASCSRYILMYFPWLHLHLIYAHYRKPGDKIDYKEDKISIICSRESYCLVYFLSVCFFFLW